MRLTPIKLKRLQKQMLQIELARRTGIPRARLSEIENGHVDARADEVERLATALEGSAPHSSASVRSRRKENKNEL